MPDRLFASVEGAWRGVLTGPSDVKELTPDWYGGAPPDWLLNAASLPLGTRQDGSPVGDVALPPWATGDTPRARASEFLRVQRAALESDAVSAVLPAWIDLIFGAKQRGKAAIAASNVFFWLTYEDAVNVSELDGEAVALVDEQVTHFGATPAQLFRRPHPQRGRAPPPSADPLWHAPDALTLTGSSRPALLGDPAAIVAVFSLLPQPTHHHRRISQRAPGSLPPAVAARRGRVHVWRRPCRPRWRVGAGARARADGAAGLPCAWRGGGAVCICVRGGGGRRRRRRRHRDR